MAITIVETPGAANANSYATVAEATAFNAARPFGTAWATAGAEPQKAALVWAAILLDSSFVWTGVSTDSVQALAWPRKGMLTRNGFAIAETEIPQMLKNAQSEWARRLIEGDMAGDNTPFKIGLESLKAGPVELRFKLPGGNSSSIDLRIADLQMREPDFAWVAKAVPDILPTLLVESWYVRAQVGQPLVFESNR